MGPGDYGPVTITQSITMDGTGGGSVGFANDGEAIYVDPAAAANVVLRNLTIDGAGTGPDGIFIASAGTTNAVNVAIDNCHIERFTQIGVGLGSESPIFVAIRNSAIEGGTLGVRTFQNSTSGTVTGFSHVTLYHSTVEGATQAGVFTRNGNVDGIASNIMGNLIGIEADTQATLNVQSTVITSNTTGACIYANSTAILATTTTPADNGTNVQACGGVVQGSGGPGPPPKI